jgi:predicted RNase H-like HicB family nuclease
MELIITLEQDEDGVWIAECPAIAGCVSQGNTQEEATENLREAIRLCLEVRDDLSMPRTREVRRIHVAA